MTSTDTLLLKKDREKSVLQGHPWIFSGAVDRVTGQPESGATVAVRSSAGEFLAWAAYSPLSQIRARIWTRQENELVESAFFSKRVQNALDLRDALQVPAETNAYRLIHAESDGLPGVIADRYGETIVLQLLSAGADYWKETLAEIIQEKTGAKAVFERSDVDVRRLEGLPERVGTLRGAAPGGFVCIEENGIRYQVDVAGGQKTGFYLDQRRNRNLLRKFSNAKEVLNCFCYTGGFTLSALAGGARSVLSIDSSADALRIGSENLASNGFDPGCVEWMEADVFHALRLFRDQARSFDLIVLDPPKFAANASQVERAARGYKDINLLAFKLLRPGGFLFTFSCSGGISPELFQKIIASAAVDANASVEIVEHMSQAPDHPISLAFPEGSYLKGLVCHKSGML